MMKIQFDERRDSIKRYQMFIDGRFVPHSSDRMISVINPATEKVISEIPAGTATEVEMAVTAAETAFCPACGKNQI